MQSAHPRKALDVASVDPIACDNIEPALRMITASASRSNRVLASLPAPDVAILERHLNVISLKPGTILQHQGHPLEYAYFPHEGLVSLLAVTPEGQTVQAASIGRGGAVCPMLDTDMAENSLPVVAVGPTCVSRIVTPQLQALERESDALGRALAACREALLLQLRQNLVCNGLHSVERRLARWLLDTADRLETDVTPIPVTQEELAQLLGVQRTTVTLVAHRLEGDGAIRWRRSRVDILDRARLEQMACSCYAALRERTTALYSPRPPRS